MFLSRCFVMCICLNLLLNFASYFFLQNIKTYSAFRALKLFLKRTLFEFEVHMTLAKMVKMPKGYKNNYL